MAKLMDCPKCQFNQPEDIFCAQCGVDMVAYLKRVPSPEKKWSKRWQAQLMIAAIGLFGLSQLLDVVGVRAALLSPSVEDALSSIDLFSQPREVTASAEPAQFAALISTGNNDVKALGAVKISESPEARDTTTPRTPANETKVDGANPSMSVVQVNQENMAALQQGGFIQNFDQKVQVAFFDLEIELHKEWIKNLKAKTMVQSQKINQGATIETKGAQNPNDRLQLRLTRSRGDAASTSNFLIDYQFLSETENIDWQRPVDLPPNVAVVFFGIFDDRWLSTPYPESHMLRSFSAYEAPDAESSVLAVVIEKD